MSTFRIVAGLPPFGAEALAFPPSWRDTGKEGLVVEFSSPGSKTWHGNFALGLGGVTDAFAAENGRDIVVVSRGTLWFVDPETRDARQLADVVTGVWQVSDPAGIVLCWQNLAFLRLQAGKVIWHTRRLSWDGFDEVTIAKDAMSGMAWSALGDRWMPFRVDLRSGRSEGGADGLDDSERWEQLASDHNDT
jgi:hypothetical protein